MSKYEFQIMNITIWHGPEVSVYVCVCGGEVVGGGLGHNTLPQIDISSFYKHGERH